MDKCEGFWLGKNKKSQRNCTLFGIKWPNQFRYLGIYLGYNAHLNEMKNWHEKIDAIESTLHAWEKRDLTLFGRVQILKTFAISKLILPATTVCIPKNIVKKINKLFYKFLWRSPDKVKRNKIVQPVEHGGLNMIDTQLFFDSLIANWINRIVTADPNLHGWVQLARVFLKPFDLEGLNVKFNFDDSVLFPKIEELPSFYRRMLKCYNRAFVTEQSDFIKTIEHQQLWGNKFITISMNRKKNVLFLRNWIRSGIRNVGDIMFVNGIPDADYIYQKLVCKENMYSEIMMVMEALRPYQQVLKQFQETDTNVITLKKSRDFYNIYRDQLLKNKDDYAIGFLDRYSENEEDIYNSVFTKKLKFEQEINLREFNFKMLHGVLPCTRNLKKWRIRLDDKCDVCELPQTIEHLLFECRYVKPLWDVIEKLIGARISFKQILGLDNLFREDSILSVISFLLYKEWLVLSLENKQRNENICLHTSKMNYL